MRDLLTQARFLLGKVYAHYTKAEIDRASQTSQLGYWRDGLALIDRALKPDPAWDKLTLVEGFQMPPGLEGDVYLNSLYQVVKREVPAKNPDAPRMWHLSIKRRDKQAVHDWRHLQRIKNELLGPEIEAVELYPAESRLVDMANQYHLWGIEGFQFPFGFADRNVGTAEAAAELGAVQRPHEVETSAPEGPRNHCCIHPDNECLEGQ